MSIPTTVRKYLDERYADYDVVYHTHTATSLRTAAAAKVPPHQIAKAVVVEDDDGYLLAVLPADRRVKLNQLSQDLGQLFWLASEDAIDKLFWDCEAGAITPLGEAYGLSTIVDDELEQTRDIYFEAGDHKQLIHMKTSEFMALMYQADHKHFAKEVR